MKLLVTGGAGFIGSNFIRYILAKHQDFFVVNYDKLTYAGNMDNLRDIENNQRYKFMKGDISDAGAVSAVCANEKPDALVNFAAETHVDRSIIDPMIFLQTNIIGTQVLLAATKTHGLRKMVQISTDESYGVNETGEFDEYSKLTPRSPYAASKAAAEHLCHAHFITYQTPVVVTHMANALGPYQYPEKLIPLAITNLIENKKVPVYGDGLQIREWIYVDDFASAVDAILQNGKVGEVYNTGTGIRKTNLQTISAILKLMGQDESRIEHVKARPGHDRRYAVNSEKIRRELKWQPKYNFEQALEKTVQWYKLNPEWWQKIKSGEYLEYYKKQYVNH